MTNLQTAVHKLNNAIRAYKGVKMRVSKDKIITIYQPQAKAWERVERWHFRCNKMGVELPTLESLK